MSVDSKTEFLRIYRENIKRTGAADLLAYLENETDFFIAPASTKHHGAHPGGLVEHSLNVYRNLRNITARGLGEQPVEGVYNLDRPVEETVAVLALLHDVCKALCYHEETKRRRNPATKQWEDYKAYTFQDPFPLGHGEKSLYIISRFMQLNAAEALAIRWHMGAYDDAVKGGSHAMNEAMTMTPLVWRLQEADMCAAWIDERGGENG
ncbi:MAG: TraI domain-containing protein [Oscillospiraceae bacterium]|nr:TraI domain-containing protein [Oscillospiraceae bacterium]